MYVVSATDIEATLDTMNLIKKFCAVCPW